MKRHTIVVLLVLILAAVDLVGQTSGAQPAQTWDATVMLRDGNGYLVSAASKVTTGPNGDIVVTVNGERTAYNGVSHVVLTPHFNEEGQ